MSLLSSLPFIPSSESVFQVVNLLDTGSTGFSFSGLGTGLSFLPEEVTIPFSAFEGHTKVSLGCVAWITHPVYTSLHSEDLHLVKICAYWHCSCNLFWKFQLLFSRFDSNLFYHFGILWKNWVSCTLQIFLLMLSFSVGYREESGLLCCLA